MNPINLTTNLSLLSSFHTFVLQLNALSFNTVLSKPSTLTILNLTFSLLLFTQNPASNSSDLSEQLSSTLNSILDIHAPLKSKTVVLRPHTPWINPEILVAKRERSRLERSWRRWKSPFDRKKFRAQCNFVRSLISKAKSNCLTNRVTESSSNPRTLWKTLNSILHRNPSNSSPDTPDTQSLANSFLQFFSDKIERIRSKFSPSDSPDPFLFPIIPPPNLSNFNPTTFSQNKQCELDSIPTFLLKLCFDELGPTIINIINFSLSEGIFPSSFKQAIVHPLLKKPSLPDDDLNNFRPISNLILSPKFSRKLLPLVSSLTYCLTPCLLHSNLPIACSIPLKSHFLVFTMTSS